MTPSGYPPQLAALPRVRLAALPAPLDEAPRLAAALSGSRGGPRILVKRDDLTGLAMGGNKVRKLEFHLGDALAQGCDVLVTSGAIQSNHCRVTAAAACKAGIDAVLVLRPGESEEIQGNLLLDHLLGARVRIAPAPDAASVDAAIADEVEALRADGRRPYVVPRGASTPLGAAAYLDAFWEMLQQATARDVAVGACVFCTGSGGTHAGLAAGAALLHRGRDRRDRGRRPPGGTGAGGLGTPARTGRAPGGRYCGAARCGDRAGGVWRDLRRADA